MLRQRCRTLEGDVLESAGKPTVVHATTGDYLTDVMDAENGMR